MFVVSQFLKASVLGLAISVGGCGSITPAGMLTARNLDPLNTPPADIAFAVEVPQELRLGQGDAEVYLRLVDDLPPHDVLVEAFAPLQISEAPGGKAVGTNQSRRLYLAELSPADAARVAQAQAQIRDLRAQNIQGRGSLGIEVVGGCLTSGALDVLPLSTWIRTSPDADFVRLTRERDILALLAPEAKTALKARLRSCAPDP